MSELLEALETLRGLRIAFNCPNPDCDARVESLVDDAVFDIRPETLADGIDEVSTMVVCDECEETYTVRVVAHPGGKDVTLVDHPSAQVDYDLRNEDAYSDFLHEYEPDAPFKVYKQALDELLDLDFGSEIYPSGKPAFFKMLYLQHVILMETYLSDRLIKIVSEDPSKMIALIGATPGLREIKAPLLDLAKDPNYLRTTVKAYLQRFSFHDLPEVAKFYKAVLKMELFESDANREVLVAACITRHHLVHRNGVDNDGNVIRIEDSQVQELRRFVEALVGRVEDEYIAYSGTVPQY